jgi:S1-C subfamily serine protease
MRRLAGLLALALLFSLPAPVRAMDAQELFKKVENSVLVVYNLNGLGRKKSQGSGFVVGDGRMAVTNHHVIKSASSLAVKTADGHVIKGVTVEADSSEHDLAVLKLPYKLPPLELAEDLPAVGQEVVAIGSPMGLERTLSTGVVSGLDREKLDNKGLIQITAPISPGSSGGPLFDTDGKVIGVTTIASVFIAQNMNFAVPSTEVRRLMGLRPASAGDVAPAKSGSLEVRQGADGAITIIQQRPKK